MTRHCLMLTLLVAILSPFSSADARERVDLRGRVDAAAVPVIEVMKNVSWHTAAFDTRASAFGPAMLQRFYTARFRSAYREARRLIREADDPFVTDPIIGGQDSCALDRINFEIERSGPREQIVYVTFEPWHCASGTEEQRNAKTTTAFYVIREFGTWRIDDIVLKGVSFRQGLIAGAKRARTQRGER